MKMNYAKKWLLVVLIGCMSQWVVNVEAEPGYRPGPMGKGVNAGEVLIAELNCTACHAAPDAVKERLNPSPAPNLNDAAKRLTPQYLYEYLKDPHTASPHTRMPSIFHSSEENSRDQVVDMLVHYLVGKAGGVIDQKPVGVNLSLVSKGERLYHTVGCVACHSAKAPAAYFAPDGERPKDYQPEPNRKHTAMRTTVDELTKFLLDPLKYHPSGRMPDMNLTDDEARAIAVYMLRDQIDKQDGAPAIAGIKAFYYEAQFGNAEPNWKELTPKRTWLTDKFDISKRDRDNHFAFRWEGVIRIKQAGKYRFHAKSDDGSWIWINGNLVVDNGGVHGAVEKSGEIELPAGDHTFVAAFYEVAGGEEVRFQWEGPEVKRQNIPGSVLFHYPDAQMKPTGQLDNFRYDERKARTGQMMFSMLRCANCHEPGKAQNVPTFGRRRPVPELAKLQLDSPAGCLSESPRKGIPKFNITKAQRDAIKATLKNPEKLSEPHAPAMVVNRTLSQLGCLQCHNRDGMGGPNDEKQNYFNTTSVIDIGDEGRIPPTLETVGAKLTDEALKDVLLNGHKVRPYMATHMPKFGKDNVAPLLEHLAKVDNAGPNTLEVKIQPEVVKDGHRLVGITGLGCINCHTFNGQKSLGIPAVDLGVMAQRLRPAWLKKFMRDPQSINKGTRMPPFWLNGTVAFKDVAGGTVDGQIEAIYQYLTLGKSMPAPKGLPSPGGTELQPGGSPLVFRTFMTDMSPRAIAVGYPELVHAAFDANVVRLGKLWRGKFFNAAGTWNGRAGGFSGPLGTDVIDLPAGPAFAVLEDVKTTAWPKAEKTSRNLGGRMKGYKLDADERPIFMYRFKGIDIEEQPIPVLRIGGADIIRRFNLESDNAIDNVYLIAGSGSEITKDGDTFVVDGKVKLKLKLRDGTKPIVRKIDGQSELLIPVRLKQVGNAYRATYDVQIVW